MRMPGLGLLASAKGRRRRLPFALKKTLSAGSRPLFSQGFSVYKKALCPRREAKKIVMGVYSMFRTYLFRSGANPYITTTQETDCAFRHRCRCRGWRITACAGDVFNVNDQELIVAWYDDNGITRAGVFHSREALNDDLVSFAVDSYDYMVLRVRGKSYHDRKAALVSLATELSNLDIADLDLCDMAEVNGFFEQEARRYGLLCEFRENGVIWG